MMNAGFIKFLRSEVAEELMRYPISFTLLAQIAFRARREVPKINPFHMEVGEAMIGDYATIGLTRQQFRQALDRLKDAGFVTTRATNKGTIAKLCNTEIYDINTVTQQPTTQPTREPVSNQQGNHQKNQPTTTNKNVKNIEEEKNGRMEEGQPASQPVFSSSETQQPAAEKEPPKGFPYQAEVFKSAGFSAFLDKMGYGQADKGHYLPEVQRAAELGKEQRDETGWENFVLRFFKNEVKYNRLVLREVTKTQENLPIGQPIIFEKNEELVAANEAKAEAERKARWSSFGKN